MAEGPQGRAEISSLLERHGLRPRKALGQHFLADPNIVRKIVELAAVGPGDQVLEVGAGTGTLTRALAETGARVVAYEVDDRLRPVLEEVVGGMDVELRFADAASVDLAGTLGPGPWVMVANLPYQVGTTLLLDLVRQASQIERFVVMVQQEVAERLAAGPGSRDYGLPSVVVRLYCAVQMGFRVAPSVFYPPPRVESAIVVLRRMFSPDRRREDAARLAAAAFSQRRKMLRRSLADALGDAEARCRRAGIDPQARPEALSPEDFLRLADHAG